MLWAFQVITLFKPSDWVCSTGIDVMGDSRESVTVSTRFRPLKACSLNASYFIP